MFVLPYFICSVLTILSAYINGITDPEILWNAGIAAAGGLLAFLLFYHTSLVAVMLTGQTVTGLLATLVLSVYPSMVLALLSPLKNAFFDSYYLRTRYRFSIGSRRILFTHIKTSHPIFDI